MKTAELRMPKLAREITAPVFMMAFVLFFIVLAVVNLANRSALLASSLWLAFIGLILFAGFKEEGFSKLRLGFLRVFARDEFIQAVELEPDRRFIRIGFRLLGFAFYRLTIPVGKIESVSWSTGQGTYFAKRDMNDWQVSIWYDHDDPVKSQRQAGWRKADQEILLIGAAQKKEITEAFGKAVAEFFREAGANLIPAEADCAFVRASGMSGAEKSEWNDQ
jgi:hypothetical protein